MATSSLWELLIESSPDGCGQFFTIKCGDLTALNYGACGVNAPVFARDYTHGFQVETSQVRDAPNNSATIQVPEFEADYLKTLHKRNCSIHIQRRNCKTNRVQHFHDVILNGQSLSRPTANGINVSDGVPVVTLPVRFRSLTEFDDDEVVSVAVTTRPTDMNLIGVVKCSCPTCKLDNDSIIWRLWSNDTAGNSLLEYSLDSGENWIVTAFQLPGTVDARNNAFAIHCFHGRIYIFTEEGYNWNFDATCKPWFDDSTVNGVIGVFGTAFAFASSGIKLVALTHFDLVSSIVKLNVANPNILSPLTKRRSEWSAVDSTTTLYNDIATHKETTIVVAAGGVYRYSTEGGDPTTWRYGVLPDGNDIVKVVLYGRDEVKSHGAIAIMATQDNKIFKVTLPRTGETQPFRYGTYATMPLNAKYTCEEPTVTELWDLCDVGIATSEITLESILGGRGLWWGRAVDNVYYYLFDSGNGCAIIKAVDSAVNFPDDSVLLLSSTSTATVHY